MRSNEPVSMGMATRTPTCVGVSFITSMKLWAVGPKSDTAPKPMKKPIVAPNSALF